MSTWIPHPTSLQDDVLLLRPMERTDFPSLLDLAADARIWQHYPYEATDRARLAGLFEAALADRDRGIQYPFVIVRKKEGELLGGTRFMDITPAHRKLEIGSTWLVPAVWGTEVNPRCKQMLLQFAFETLGAHRVYLKTDALNLRSRKAIAKLGATFEGVLRQDILRDNGTFRDSAYFSILTNEWSKAKAVIALQIEAKRINK